MFSKMASMTVLIGVMATSVAFADKMGPNGDKFYEEAAHFENACFTEPCKGPYSKKLVYDQATRFSTLETKERIDLKAVAVYQSQVWGDTILEGDYYATGLTRIDQVYAYYKDETLIGYKIQYSQKAWYTGNCEFDGSRGSLSSCLEGRIVETSFVSADTLTFFSDEERYAEFRSSTIY